MKVEIYKELLLEAQIKELEIDKEKLVEILDRQVFLQKLVAKTMDCLQKGYAILSKSELVEAQSNKMKKKIKNFIRQYNKLEHLTNDIT